MKRVLLKISGEALGGEKKLGISPKEIKLIAKQIKEAYDLKIAKIGIVCGGGNFFRGRDALEVGIERVDCDYMGMMGTILNSIALKNALNVIGCPTKVLSCLEVKDAIETYTKEKANEYLESGFVVIYAGGLGKPYFSTDTASLTRSVETNVKLVLMAKNGVDGVYDKDPRQFKDAKKIEKLTHKEILENKLEVMDLEAAKIADEFDIDIHLFDMDSDNAITRAIKGEIFGTIITK